MVLPSKELVSGVNFVLNLLKERGFIKDGWFTPSDTYGMVTVKANDTLELVMSTEAFHRYAVEVLKGIPEQRDSQ